MYEAVVVLSIAVVMAVVGYLYVRGMMQVEHWTRMPLLQPDPTSEIKA